jgi:predicted metal-dependent hydrolase
MRTASQHNIQIGGRRVDYRIVHSATARKLRIRVGPNGVEIVKPAARKSEDIANFLDRNVSWLLDQLKRVEQLRRVRKPEQQPAGKILFHGEPTRIRVETTRSRARRNGVHFTNGEIVIRRGTISQIPMARSLENWLRRQARNEIEKHLTVITARLRHRPRRLYVMGQRTKWGNCSPQKNLSFNWRLILAPEFVIRYLIVHEAVHLAVPDHSAKFWLTVQSLCRESEKARQWLSANGSKLFIDLTSVEKKVS